MNWSEVVGNLDNLRLQKFLAGYRLTIEPLDIEVDFVNYLVMELPGKLGMTHAPGKPGLYEERVMDDDIKRLKEEYKTDVLVSLVTNKELKQMGIRGIFDTAAENDISSIRFPIKDFSIPKNLESVKVLVEEILSELRAGRNVVIHCWGGFGRTGMIAACVLVEFGYNAEDAMWLIRNAREWTIETSMQEAFIRAYDFYRNT